LFAKLDGARSQNENNEDNAELLNEKRQFACR